MLKSGRNQGPYDALDTLIYVLTEAARMLTITQEMLTRAQHLRHELLQDLDQAECQPSWWNCFRIFRTRRKLVSAIEDLNANLATVKTAADNLRTSIQAAVPLIASAQGVNTAVATVAASLAELGTSMSTDATTLNEAVAAAQPPAPPAPPA